MEAVLLDQLEYPLPVIAEEEKEVAYYEVTFYMACGNKPYFWNVEKDNVDRLKQDYKFSAHNNTIFEWTYNGGYYLFNGSQIEYINVKKQARKKKNQYDNPEHDNLIR